MSKCASHQDRMYSPSLEDMMKEVIHKSELEKVETSASTKELKQYITEKLRAAHRERRQPYVDLLNKLWMQQRGQSFAA